MFPALQVAPATDQTKQAEQVELVPLNLIVPGNNDRKDFGNITKFAKGLTQVGLIQPIVLHPIGGGKFQIAAGERRWRAHCLYTEKVQAGEWEETPHLTPGYVKAIIREMTDLQISDVMLAENVKRKNLNYKEEAIAYDERVKKGQPIEEVAEKAGVSVAVVEQRIDLLKLAPDILDMVAHKQIALAYADEMVKLDHNRQRLAIRVLRSGYVSIHSFKSYVSQLLEEQAQDSLFDLSEFWVEQVEAMNEGPKNGKSAVVDLPQSDTLPPCEAKYGTPVGDIMFGYIQDLLAQGLDQEAAAVGNVYRKLIDIRRATIPKQVLE